MTTRYKRCQFFVAFITFALTLGFTTIAMGQTTTTAPNPGGSITVDGIADFVNEWDPVADFYAEMERASGNPTGPKPVEANSYVRLDSENDMIYVLVMTTATVPNVITTDIEDVFVKIDGKKPNWIDFAWVGLNGDGTLAEGWEVSFVEIGKVMINSVSRERSFRAFHTCSGVSAGVAAGASR